MPVHCTTFVQSRRGRNPAPEMPTRNDGIGLCGWFSRAMDGHSARRRLRQMTLALAALLSVGFLIFGTAPPARADEDDWAITRYAVTAETDEQSVTRVTVDFDFDFGDTPGHGPYVVQPIRQRIAGDPDHWRSMPITEVSVASSTGAPATAEEDVEGGALQVRIGDKDVEVSGVQSYRLTYTVRGLTTPGVAPGGGDELSWNVIGTEWEVPISNISVTLSGPASVSAVACSTGATGTQGGCASSAADGTRATATAGVVEPGNSLTLNTEWPTGTFPTAPLLTERRHLGNTFAPSPAAIGIGVLLAALGAGGLARARRAGADERWVGLTPGTTPVDGVEVPTTRGRSDAPVTVRFTPPDDARPGQIGTLIDGVVHHHDVTATLIDLAVRGHLRIEEVPPDETSSDPQDWRLVATGAQRRDLLPYEVELLDGVLDADSPLKLSELGSSYATTLASIQKGLHSDVTDRGWFRSAPTALRGRWYGIGVALVLGGVALALALAFTVGWGLVGLGVIAVGIATFFVASKMTARTAVGSAVLDQAKGFQLYLETAEANQIKFEEGQDLFSRYLPYAIAFGVAERWAKVFRDLAAQGVRLPEPSWYVGSWTGAAFANASFTSQLTAFSSQATAAMTSATVASSGGSGFSSGAGGGVGGGGGGGW